MSATAAVPNWYALYVRSRHEFLVEEDLRSRGVEVYLPVIERLRQWKDRRKLVSFPVFPSYLFVNVPPANDSFHEVIRTRGVVTLLGSRPGEPTPVPSSQIDSLRLLFECGDEVDVFPHLKEGTRVRVVRGALAGAEGVIGEKGNRQMLLVNLGLLGRSVGVRVLPEDVELL